MKGFSTFSMTLRSPRRPERNSTRLVLPTPMGPSTAMNLKFIRSCPKEGAHYSWPPPAAQSPRAGGSVPHPLDPGSIGTAREELCDRHLEHRMDRLRGALGGG